MRNQNRNSGLWLALLLSLILIVSLGLLCDARCASAAGMTDYCIQPPFIASTVPPIVMMTLDRSEKLSTEAYSDSFDLDDDGRIETTYKHSVDYYGYFDSYKCYTYDSGGTGQFNAVSDTTSKFCSTGQWSGNILNWLTMSRIDVLKKVLYGGHRISPDSTSHTILERIYVPHENHSYGKEVTGRICHNTGTVDGSHPLYTSMCEKDSDCISGYDCIDKSNELIGRNAALVENVCSFTSDITYNNSNNKILVVKYSHADISDSDIECGVTGSKLIESFEPANYLDHFYLDTFNTADSTPDPNAKDVIPTKDHGSHNNYVAVAEFNVPSNKKGIWQFAVDGDDGVELEIDGVIVASYYGCHPSCSTTPTTICELAQVGSIDIQAATYHRLIARVTNNTVSSGVKVWYKRPGDSAWSIFGQSSNLTIRSPIIDTAAKVCTLKSIDFVNTGTPIKGTVARHHLFCNVSNNASSPPLLRQLNDRSERIWDWISREVVQCGTQIGVSTSVTPTDYTVRVKVCDKNSSLALESNCKQYGTGSSTTQKPVGLLQNFGDITSSDKVCSRDMSTSCTNDNSCIAANNGGNYLGICTVKSRMYFGLLTGSYTNNLKGGVLRKNIYPITDEVDPDNGFFMTSNSIPSNLIETFDKLRIIDYLDGSDTYQNCVAHDTQVSNGKCRDWGNPLAEMIYESLRYLAGKGTPTSGFDYTNATDPDKASLNLPHPGVWGYGGTTQSNKIGPFDVYPYCSKPFLLLMGDVNPNYDADNLAGVEGSSVAEDSNHPVMGFDRLEGGKKLLSKLVDDIGTNEGIIGDNWFIGDNGTTYDFMCTEKSVGSTNGLHGVRGLCPEQPTWKGSFFTAALAYYANSFMKTEIGKDTSSGVNTHIPNTTTFAVAYSSPLGTIKIRAGGKDVTLVPMAKSVSGSSIYTSCAQRCTLASKDGSNNLLPNGLSITGCSSTAFCPTNAIVKVFMESVKYDSSNNVVYALFRVNFADTELGQDYDMDAVAKYEICTQAAYLAGYGSCASMDADKLQVNVTSDYAAGGIDQVLGFIISGTTEDGTYLTVRDKTVTSADGDTPAAVAALPFFWSHPFSVSGSAAGFLKNPLWYAAKWGGFVDKNGNNIPDQQSEWDADGDNGVPDGEPDTYFPVVNPLKLESQMRKAFEAILARVSSGTAASILNNSEGSGANLLQAVFYPKKSFNNNTEATWLGEMQNLWYYLDPFLQKTSIREDTNTTSPPQLNLTLDRIAKFYFDTGESKTWVQLFSDSNGDGSPDSATPDTTVDPDFVASLWRAGQLLHARDVSASGSPRTIYSYTTGSDFTTFDTTSTNIAKLKPYLDVSNDDTKATAVIKYVTGFDDLDDTSLRSRTVSYKGVGGDLTDSTVRSNAKNKGIGVWKLGDIISSTPKLLSNIRLNSYSLSPPLGYNDTTYTDFVKTSTYKNRGMAFVGANDGMLHAFKLGTLEEVNNKYVKAKITGSDLGKEIWSFIPKNALPYLKYLSSANPEYCHLYFVDNTTALADVSINKSSTSCAASNYWECDRKYGTSDLSWRTILIGGMGLGGASKNTVDAQCVKTPIQVTEGGTAKDIGYSSYFALDVTDPASPAFKWEFSGDPANGDYLGYTTTGPAIVRVGDRTKNGRWFAVFASGPTGPIDTTLKEFKGTSNQPLKLFIVDVATGSLVQKITTTITNAFAGSLASGVIDTDRWDANSTGFYSDDAVYIGYVQKDLSTGTWTKGGVIRLLTQESPADPITWTWSKVIENTGPVTTSITKLQDRKNKNLWLFFGTGRYFFKMDDGSTTTRERLYGIKEPCYSENTGSPLFTPIGPVNDINNTCSSTVTSGLVDQTTSPDATLSAADNGWYIELDAASGGFLSERIITDPLAAPSGAVFFTSFKPTGDICGYGGNSYIWSVRYDTGAEPPAAALKGVALMQVSTGSFAEIKLSEAFTDKDKRRIGTPITGVPPKSQGLSLLAPPRPTKKMLQIQEK